MVVGIGINADWRERDFPPELAGSMTSLREASGGRPIDREALLAGVRGSARARGSAALRTGYFDLATWAERQATTGRLVTLDDDPRPIAGAGRRRRLGRARGR